MVHYLRSRGQGFLAHKVRQKQIELSGVDPVAKSRKDDAALQEQPGAAGGS